MSKQQKYVDNYEFVIYFKKNFFTFFLSNLKEFISEIF